MITKRPKQLREERLAKRKNQEARDLLLLKGTAGATCMDYVTYRPKEVPVSFGGIFDVSMILQLAMLGT